MIYGIEKKVTLNELLLNSEFYFLVMFQFQIGTSGLIFWSQVFLIQKLNELNLKYIWEIQALMMAEQII